jgi:hypothetical protein
MVPIGRLGVETARCCIVIGRELCTARQPTKRTDSRTAPPAVAGQRRSAGDQAWFHETEQGKVRLTTVKRRFEELDKHADDEKRWTYAAEERSSREIDKELQAANKINLQPDFTRLASPETPDKASEE